jgi:hypothetical protein
MGMLLPPRLQTVMMNFPFHAIPPLLFWLRVIVMMGSRSMHMLLAPPPLAVPLFALTLPRCVLQLPLKLTPSGRHLHCLCRPFAQRHSAAL